MGLFDLCSRKKAVGQLYNQTPPPAPSGTWFIGPFNKVPVAGDAFDFTPPPGIHYVTKATGALPYGAMVTLRFRFEGGPISAVQGSTPTVSLYFQRAGDNWSAQGVYRGYRWYHAGIQVAPGEYELSAPLTPDAWGDVLGGHDESSFQAALAGAAEIGFVFGDPSAGATGHGVAGTGKFTILSFDVK